MSNTPRQSPSTPPSPQPPHLASPPSSVPPNSSPPNSSPPNAGPPSASPPSPQPPAAAPPPTSQQPPQPETPPATPPPSPALTKTPAAVDGHEDSQTADEPSDAAADDAPGLFAAARQYFSTALRESPAVLVSLIFHMIIFLVLALISMPIVGDTPLIMQLLASSNADNNLESLDDLELESFDNATDNAVSYDTAPTQVLPAAASVAESSKSVFDASPLNAPSIKNALRGREARSKEVLLLAYGGNDQTEASVREALLWLKRQQKNDGTWSLTGPYTDGGVEENRAAATAMALLAFQGAGNTHLDGLYKTVVENGTGALLRMQDSEGNFFREGPGHHRLYTQAQATIAICELFGMTGDEELRVPCERAIEYAVRIQSSEGGWRYEPGRDSDTSVTGWFVMALQSARMAGLQVPQNTLDRVGRFLNTVSKNGGSRYSYVPDRGPSPSMTAEGLLCRQYLGWSQQDPRLNDGVDYLLNNTISFERPDAYYWYYATQVTHHMGGEPWAKWNAVMRDALPANQVPTGRNKGSWDPGADRHGQSAGRLYMTCLCVYMLEVYYRHLPIYQDVELPEL